MVYKKYVKRGGKTFGPYYYESYRDKNGKVKKRYLGSVDPNESKKLVSPTAKKALMFMFILVFLLAGVFVYDQESNLENRDFSFAVKDFFSNTYGKLTGLVVEDVEDVEDVEEVIDEVEEVIEEPREVIEEVEEVVIEEVEEVVEEGGGSGGGDDDEALGVKEGGEVLSDELGEGGDELQVAEEVAEDGEEVDEVLNVTEVLGDEEDNVTGEEVLENVTDEEDVVDGVLENVTEEENVTEVEESEEVEGGVGGIENISENINETDEVVVNETLLNDTIVDEVNLTIGNITDIVNETLLNETLLNETNITVVENVTEFNLSAVNVSEISTLQYKAVIGRPVKWIKKVNVTNKTNISIEIPKEASDISVLTNGEISEAESEAAEYEDVVNESDREDLSEGLIITGNVVVDVSSSEGVLTKIWNFLTSFSISGNVVLEEDLEGEIIEGENFTVVDLDDIVNETGASEVAVEYTTPAPVANETDLENGKRIVVSAPSSLNYTEILAYALVDDLVAMNDSRLRMYWYEEEEREGISLSEDVGEKLINGSDGVRREVEFVSYDFDDDGYMDYVEWVVPHLSVQVYELIYIVKAEHLDSNRTFISDVYDYVSAQDGNGVYIGDGEYLRVTFEKELDSSKDITVYAKQGCDESILINGTEIPCDIYWKKVRLDELRRELDG